jgi:hypothetical protein
MAAIRRHFDLIFDVVFLVAVWVIAVVRDFDGFVLTMAILWTARVVLFDRKGYRLVTRGWSWEPSRNPDHYR